MSETKTKWTQFAITTVIGIAWNIFDRWAQLQPFFESWLPWVSPFVYVAIGGFLGYMICSALRKRQLSDKDAEIERLSEENLSLQKQLDTQKVPGAVTALQAMAGAASRATDRSEAEEPKYKTPSAELVLQMSPVVASRVYRAYEKGEHIPLSEIEPAAINSIGSKDGLFEFKQFVNPFGQPLEAKEYGLTRAWIAFLDDQTHLRQLRTIAGECTDSDEETAAWEDAIEALSKLSAEEGVDSAFSGITRAEARVLLDYADGRQRNHSKFDSEVKSLLEKRVLRVIGRDDADAPLPGDDLGVSDEWTKLLNGHHDEFVRYFGLEAEK